MRTSGTVAAETLATRALNRALLARQMLLERAAIPPLAAIERLVGMQAQAPLPPYFGLAARLESFRPVDLSQLILDRQVVRIALMRSTVHLVSARDCLTLRPLLQPMLDRGLLPGGNWGRLVTGMDLDAIAEAGRQLVEEEPRTLDEVGKLLTERWRDCDATALAHVIRARVPLVQVPPRGIWGAGGLPVCTSAEAWLGRPLDPAPSIDAIILRYLGAFGPASVLDAQAWSGLTRLREAFERLRPNLATFRDETGRELFDLPKAPRPHPDTPAPARFLSEYDITLLSHADRARIISEAYRKERVFTVNGIIRAVILVDGFVRGLWSVTQNRTRATLTIEPFTPLSNDERTTLEMEGERLLTFAAPGKPDREIEFI